MRPLVDGHMTFGDFIELMSEVMVQTTRWGNLATKLEGYVGFDTVQEQIRKKNLKRGFELNLMVVGKLLRKLCHSTDHPPLPVLVGQLTHHPR